MKFNNHVFVLFYNYETCIYEYRTLRKIRNHLRCNVSTKGMSI